MSVFQHMQRGDFTLPNAERHYAPDLQIEPIHLDLYITPDLESQTLDGKIYHRVRVNVDGASSLELQGTDLEIVNVQVVDNDTKKPLNGNEIDWYYDDKAIDIEFRNELKEAEEYTIEVTYQVCNPVGGLYFGGPTPEVPNRGLWMCSDHETQRARYWFACYDHSNVRTTVDVFITHKKEFTALGPGRLVSEQKSNIKGYKTTHWSLHLPCPSYLLCVAVGDFVKWDGGTYKGKPVAAFAPKPITEADLERNFKPTVEMITLLSQILSELPWDKYYQFAFPGLGGAMENISLVTWDEYWVFDDVMHEDLGTLVDQINLHELAHTWFGDLIVCRDYAHVWLKESWATYMETVWKEKTMDIDSYHMELISQRRRYFGEVKSRYSRPIQTRVFDTPWQMYDAHLYPGGSVRLHMLRKKVGDDIFWKGVKNYIETYMHRVVESVDFRKCMEEVSHLSLAHFFEQWYERAGYPHLRIESKYNKRTQTLEIKSHQKLIGAEKDTPMFEFEMEVAVEYADGNWESHTLNISSEHNVYSTNVDVEPVQIVVNPNCASVVQFDLSFPSAYYDRTLEDCPYVYGRVRVAESLISSGKPKAIQKVLTYLQNESSAEARAMIVRSCKKKILGHVRDMLLQYLETETHTWVIITIFDVLGSFPHPDVAETIIDYLQRPNLPYRVTTSALMALANQKDDCQIEVIVDYLHDSGWYRYVQRGAVQALGAIQTSEAADHLVLVLKDYSKHAPQVHRAALLALANCVKWLPEVEQRKAIFTMLPYLEHPTTNVRRTAVQAIGKLPAIAFIDRLESARILFCEQDQPVIERAIMSIRKMKPSDNVDTLRRRIERLEAKLNRVVGLLGDK